MSWFISKPTSAVFSDTGQVSRRCHLRQHPAPPLAGRAAAPTGRKAARIVKVGPSKTGLKPRKSAPDDGD